MEQIRSFAVEIGVASVVGLSLLFVKNKKHKYNPLLENTTIVKTTPIADAIIELCELQPNKLTLDELINECDSLLVLTNKDISGNTPMKGRQFLANRKLTNVEKICKRMCSDAKESRNIDRIDAAILCEKDAIPQIVNMCSTHLQNMLLE